MLKTISVGGKNESVIVWLPHAGGYAEQAHYYFSSFKEDFTIFSVDYLRKGELFEDRIMSICKTIYDRNLKDIFLIGFSLGGYLAFEIANRLQKVDSSIKVNLFLIGVANPLLLNERIEEHIQNNIYLLKVKNRNEFYEYYKDILREDFRCLKNYIFDRHLCVYASITIFNGDKDALCSRKEVIDYWHLKTKSAFSYNEYRGRHIPDAYMLKNIICSI